MYIIMQRDIESVEITFCDEDFLPYEESEDKDDPEWNEQTGRYELRRKVHFKRRCIYHGSFIAFILMLGGLFYWTYDVLNNYSDLSGKN